MHVCNVLIVPTSNRMLRAVTPLLS